ncbi:hypothetical protein [Planomonospora venezuelensis]|uniref:Uncharacterized protein n=1 Tax=Planomonospora venezuelensis TaxID=1999 RepID=A0A841CX56_PLAVE|nr:hypothetical protein [Planomonospora venezuelensis]MBB5962992.1 hypothetical protein [Planomonospora venezuelensis]GIN00560.1 hypothetical protein Pve01_22180 [Planomonospora venezuelensis]
MTFERVQRRSVVGRTFLAGLAGGAATGAICTPLPILVLLVGKILSGDGEPSGADGPGSAYGSGSGSSDSSGATAVVLAIAALVKLGAIGAAVGAVVGLIVAVPVAMIMAAAAPGLVGQPLAARMVCACACGLSTVAFIVAIIAPAGSWDQSFFGNPLLVGPPLVFAVFVGYRYGPRLVAADAPGTPAPSAGAETVSGERPDA